MCVRFGTGEQIGEISEDHYFIRYQLEELKGRLVVAQTSHAAPPKMSQAAAIGSGAVAILHGVASAPPDAGAAP